MYTCAHFSVGAGVVYREFTNDPFLEEVLAGVLLAHHTGAFRFLFGIKKTSESGRGYFVPSEDAPG